MKGIRHKVLAQGGRRLRLVEYSEELEPHWCERGHLGMVLEGRMEITFNGATHVFGAGDGVFIPAGAEHRHMGRALSGVARALFVEEA